jgi:hypothetical protein
VPGMWGGEQDFDSWADDFVGKMTNEKAKISLVLLVMSSQDRSDFGT